MYDIVKEYSKKNTDFQDYEGAEPLQYSSGFYQDSQMLSATSASSTIFCTHKGT